MNRERIKIILILNIFIFSFIPLFSGGVFEKIEENSSLTQDTFPLGTANADYELVVSHLQASSNGPTTFSDETGKTYFYDLQVNNFPVISMLEQAFGSNVSSILQEYDLNGTQLFIKVLRQENNIMDIMTGLKLGNDIILNTSTIIGVDNLPTFLQSLVIPKDLTGLIPANLNFLTTPFSEKEDSTCLNYCNFDVSPFGLYLDPNNFTGHNNALSKQLAKLSYESNKTEIDWIDWKKAPIPNSVGYFEMDQWSKYYYENTTVIDGKISMSLPVGSFPDGVFITSSYDFSLSPYNQGSTSPAFYLNKPNSNEFFYDRTSNFTIPNYFDLPNGTRVYAPIPNGTPVTVPFYFDTNLFADGNYLFVPQENISRVYGVYAYRDVGWMNFDDVPATVTNYYSGGPILNKNNITLNSFPSDKLVVYFERENQPITTIIGPTYQPGNSFNFGLNLSSTVDPLASLELFANWDILNNPSSGWMNNLNLKFTFDANNDSYTSSVNEVIDISLVLNKTATFQTPNPLAVGDTGTYQITKSNLQMSLTPDYQMFWDNIFPNTTTEIQDALQTFNNKKLLDYQVIGVDGLYYTLSGTNYDPANDSNPITSTFTMDQDAFSAFNSLLAHNNTYSNGTIWSFKAINDYSEEIENYYNTIFPSAPISWTKTREGYRKIVENVTITDPLVISLSLPYSNNNNFFYFKASDYNFNLPTWEQNFSLVLNLYSNQYYANNSNVLYFSGTNWNGTDWVDGHGFPIGSDIVVIYTPDSNINSIDGKIYIPYNLDSSVIYEVNYADDYVMNPNNYTYYDPLFTTDGYLSGKVIILNSSVPNGMFRVSVSMLSNNFNNHKVYSTNGGTSIGVFPAITNLFTYITPARTAGDFNLLKQDSNAVNTLSNGSYTYY
jgi:hypothetical protein